METTKLDFSTPEGAVLMLEDAYRNKNLEAAIAAKDFYQDAFYFLGLQFGSDMGKAKEMASAMENNFRLERTQNGFPNYSDVKTSFLKREDISPDKVILTERCRNGVGHWDLRLLVVKTDRGWRTVLAPGFDTK